MNSEEGKSGVSESVGAWSGADGTKLWREWYEAWAEMLGGGREAYMDPFGLYRQMLGSPQDVDEEQSAEVASPQDTWLSWMEVTADAWRRTLGTGARLARLTPYWVEMAEGLLGQMLEGGRPPTDPLDFYMRWYNATNVPLSKMIGDVLRDESFLGDSRRMMENYASLEEVFQRTADDYFGYLQLSTRSDSTRIAELVVSLDAKVDRMEEAFEDFEDRVDDLERKLDENSSDMRRMEDKLDQLISVLNTLGKGGPEAVGSHEVEATDAARRKARELDVDLRTVEGSGTGGRITVDDLRNRGDT